MGLVLDSHKTVPCVSKSRGVWLLAPPKANKQARLVDRYVCFISDASNWEGKGDDICSVAESPQTLTSRVRAFVDRAGAGG